MNEHSFIAILPSFCKPERGRLGKLARLVYVVYMETKRLILNAAREAFDRDGPTGLSMRDIAKTVEITPMAIYRHYADKQALIDALVLDALDEWSVLVAAIVPTEPLAWLRAIGEAHLDFALLQPRRYELAFLTHTNAARRYPDDFVAGRSPAGTLQLRLIEQLMADGVLTAASAIEIGTANAAVSQGLITLYYAGRIAGREEEFRGLYRAITARCMAGFFTEKMK
jgi:AcrR family transcriptional regulator